MLQVSHDDLWYGTITPESIAFGAEERLPEEVARVPSPTPGVAVEEGPPPELVLDESLYAPRKKTSDSRSYYSGPRVVGRGFEIDWSRMNQERFRRLIANEDDGGFSEVDGEVAEIKEVLDRHRDNTF